MKQAPGYLFLGALAVSGIAVFTNTDTMSSIAAYAQGCRVKGDVNTLTGEKTYFLKGDPNYESIQIRMEYGDRFFCGEEEAIQAGFTKARNQAGS